TTSNSASTPEMAEAVRQVVAVELDRKMLPVLADSLEGYPNVAVVQGDILEIDPVTALAEGLEPGVGEEPAYKVVANLPYYITSNVLRHLLSARVRPRLLTVMVQQEVADRITVIRRGKVVETMPRKGATKEKIAELMVGKPVMLDVQNPPAEPGEAVLEVDHLSAVDERGTKVLSHVSLRVRRGEIVGIAGVEGNGQSELVYQITEDYQPTGGDIRLRGESIVGWDVRRRREAGIAHIPEDRHRQGLLMSFSLADNLCLGRHHRPPFVGALGFRDTQRINAFAREAIEAYDVRTPDETTEAHALSGGNQQKVIIAREISGDPSLLVASQPTRGVDIGATEFIYKQIVNAKKDGRAVLLVSADLDEVMALADRILVMYKGRVVYETNRREATKEKVGYYMTGEAEHDTIDA
ncbi:MAG: rRNA adenine N-6-methyltransferase family protein, partial [Spirochaetota bacterium]